MSADPTLSHDFSQDILSWYDLHARELPWRMPPIDASAPGCDSPEPYRVWLSEIMLQQTRIQTVEAYYAKFLHLWPTVRAMAHAERQDVLRAWAGLGYYARARNLHNCAKTIVDDHGGEFPADAASLKQLPGIGEYTSAAIAAICSNERIAVVDGNVERVVARYYCLPERLPALKAQVRVCLSPIVPVRAGDFAQAMMDVGSTICTPKKPNCDLCPLHSGCSARSTGKQETFPIKKPKKKPPTRRGTAYVATSSKGMVLLEHRPESGLLAAMTGVPTTDWVENGEVMPQPPFDGNWHDVGEVEHIFTHFRLLLRVLVLQIKSPDSPADTWWQPADQLAAMAIPKLFQKVLKLALASQYPEG